jgi:dynein heavy chain
MSPVGELLRVRSRKFPSLVNCCTLDWFSNWPKEALLEVANRFLDKMTGIGNPQTKESIA